MQEGFMRPMHQMFPTPWTFVQVADGSIMLGMVSEMGPIIPTFLFLSPESMRAFLLDTEGAYKRFVPITVREALEAINSYEKEKGKGKLIEQGRENSEPK